MFKLIFGILCFLSFNLYSQDSSQTYISLNTNLISNTGTIGKNTSTALEIGKQWNVFSLGFVTGQIGSELYNELRPNLNVFQQGKFVNTFTPGVGYIYKSEQPIVIEFTTGIEYSCTNTWHLNINFGQYYFSGKNGYTSNVFIGLSIAKFFTPFTEKSLIKEDND
jgi:hypothetical protein